MRTDNKSIFWNNFKVISVDFFDTLFWRTYIKPVDVFPAITLLLQKEALLEPDISPGGFANIRKQAETHARKMMLATEGHHEVTLPQIYAEIPSHILNRDNIANAVALEIQAENDCLVPDSKLFNFLTQKKNEGFKLALCSDTYYSAEDLAGFIERSGFDSRMFDAIVVSNRHYIAKSQGLLACLTSTFSVEPSEIIHFGDHHVNDMWSSELVGVWKRPHALLNNHGFHAIKRLETVYSLTSKNKPFLESDKGIIGLGRRFVQDYIGSVEETEASITGYVFGPLLTGFFLWLTRQAEFLQKKIIIFPTREGVYLSQAFNEYCRLFGSKLIAIPLQTSRKALDLASLTRFTKQSLANYVFKRRLPISPRTLVKAFGMEIIQTEISSLYYDLPLREDCDLSQSIIEILSDDESFKAGVLEHCQAARAGFLSYFGSQIMCHTSSDRHEITDFMVADVGWSGSSLRIMNNILSDHYQHPLPGRFLLLDESAIRNVMNGIDIKGWLTSYGEIGDFGNVLNPVKEILEQIFMPPLPAVISYSRDGSPVLSEKIMHPCLQEIQKNRLQSLITAYIKHYYESCNRLSHTDASKIDLAAGEPVLRASLAAFYYHPNDNELELFSGWAHEDNHSLHSLEPIINRQYGELFKRGTLDEIFRTPCYWHLATVRKYAKAQIDTVFLRQYTGQYGEGEPGVTAYPMEITDISKKGAITTTTRNLFVNNHGSGVLSLQFYITFGAGKFSIKNLSHQAFRIDGVSMEIYSADSIIYEYKSTGLSDHVSSVNKYITLTSTELAHNQSSCIEYSEYAEHEKAMEVGMNIYFRRL